MKFDVFLMMLPICSIFTSLTVEAIKQMFMDGKSKRANFIAAIVSIVVAIGFSLVYAVFNAITFNLQFFVSILALCFLSWLCSMIGYDKVIQAIKQFANVKNDGGDKK